MTTRLRIILIGFLLTGCGRSEVLLSVVDQTESPQAQSAGSAAPEVCDPCATGLPDATSLRCFCQDAEAACPADLPRALADLKYWDAYGEGCNEAWLLRRTERGFQTFAFQLRSGDLVFGQRTRTDAAPACVSGDQALLPSGGKDAKCSNQQWCTFKHARHPIGLGVLDMVEECDEARIARRRR